MAEPRFKKALVVGIGLLGGSLALALKKRGLAGKVSAWGRDLGRMRPALRAGLVDEISVSPESARGADLIVLCSPFGSFEGQLKQLALHAPGGCLATDVGSVKGAEVERWHRAAGPLRFVASHPMAGGERSGWRHASADLFEGAACLLTPLARTDRSAVLAVGTLWQDLGMDVALVSPAEHDRLIARVSHLPHAAAFALAAAQTHLGGTSDFAWAGKGWFDTSRVAGSDPGLWADIFLHHPRRMEASLKALETESKRLRGLLKSGRRKALLAWLERASNLRRASEEQRRDNGRPSGKGRRG
jgi:prephenate dehydrogenase